MNKREGESDLNTGDRTRKLEGFCRAVGIDGVDLELVDIALTHKSYTYENPETAEHNERLEFLGDAVVGLAVARYLYELLPDRPEEIGITAGSGGQCAGSGKAGQRAASGSVVAPGTWRGKTGGREQESLLANAFEALVGAIYLSLGNQRAQVVLTQLAPEIERLLTGNRDRSQSALQEVLQKFSTEVPTYEVYKETGRITKEFQVVVQWRVKS